MRLVERSSRFALVPAAGSTTTPVARGHYTTIWSYRDGYVATTDPAVAGVVAVGAVCLGVAALVHAFCGRSMAVGRWSDL